MLMIVQLKPMISRYQFTRMLFPSIVMSWLLTLSGAMMMLVPLLFALLVSCLSLPLSLWA